MSSEQAPALPFRSTEPSRRFVSSSSHYLEMSSAGSVTGAPCTLACWFNAAAAVTGKCLSFGASGNEIGIGTSGGLKGRLVVRDNTPVTMMIDTVNSHATSRWHHLCGRVVSSTERYVYLDGSVANRGSSTASANASGFVRTRIGSNARFLSEYFDGQVFWAFAWSIDLLEGQVARLAAGVEPWKVEPRYLAVGPELFTLHDPYARNVFSATGTTPDAPAPVRHAKGRRRWFTPASTSGSVLAPFPVTTSVNAVDPQHKAKASPSAVVASVLAAMPGLKGITRPLVVELEGSCPPANSTTVVKFFKHADFQVPGWWEFPGGPQVVAFALRPHFLRPASFRASRLRPERSGQGVVLIQSEQAAFPDRPESGGVGVLVSMVGGTDGQSVEHDLGNGYEVVHTRVLLATGTGASGRVTVIRGIGADGTDSFRVELDCSTREVTLVMGTLTTIVADLPEALPWHCLEVGFDGLNGHGELWLNGVSMGSIDGASIGPSVAKVMLGGMLKDATTIGELYLDEWVVSDRYIGPVVMEPLSDHADDPRRWLVIYNSGDPESVAWAEHYRSARRVPFANLLGLNLSGTETIGTSEYVALRSAILSYLRTNELDSQVMGLLFGYKVPGYVDFAGFGDLDSIAGLMHDLGTLPKANPLGRDAVPTQPTKDNLQGLRLTARIDAPTLGEAEAFVTRSIALETTGLGDGSNATIWLDPYTTPGEGTNSQIASMSNWASGIDRMRTRLPLVLSATVDPQAEVQFESIHHDGFFWGWSAATVPNGFFVSPSGSRVFCFQLHSANPTASTLRANTPANWVQAAVSAGYASAAGASRSYSPTAMPYIRPFFDALRRGWALAEAWFVANPLPTQGLFLVGDPLLTVAMPRQGWDVFGPLSRLENLVPESPAVALRDQENEALLATSSRPGSGAEAYYVIRHIDSLGRSEAGARMVRVANVDGAAVLPPLAPCWPDTGPWSVLIEDGYAKPRIVWDRPIRSCRVSTVELLGMFDGNAEQVLRVLTPEPSKSFIEAVVEMPAISALFRWRVHSPGGAVLETPWSSVVRAAESPSKPLQIVEVDP